MSVLHSFLTTFCSQNLDEPVDVSYQIPGSIFCQLNNKRSKNIQLPLFVSYLKINSH